MEAAEITRIVTLNGLASALSIRKLKEMTLCSFKLNKCNCIVNISKYIVEAKMSKCQQGL